MKTFVKVMMSSFIMLLTAVCVYTQWSIIGSAFLAVLALVAIWEGRNNG
jgi:hypothetical protein